MAASRQSAALSKRCLCGLSAAAGSGGGYLKARIGFGNAERLPKGETDAEKKRLAELKAWPQDVLRHTGISSYYRVNGDEAKTASWAGNSPDMVHGHYRALMSASDAKAFFAIMPKAKKGGKIVELKPEVAAEPAIQLAQETGS